MKKIFTQALILALMLLAGLSVAAAFCFDTDSAIHIFIAERVAFAIVCVGSYKLAETLYRKHLTGKGC